MAEGNKVALVTGGAKRIGRAIALELARGGYDVAVHCHTSRAEAIETARMIGEMGRRSTVLSADLGDPEAAAALPRRTAEALGSLSILVNNASTFEKMPFAGFRLEDWNATLAVNLTGPMVLSHAAYEFLKESPPGHIVNLLDIASDRPWPDYLAYCTSKAALSTLTLALAKALAPEVHVNGVAPGAALFPESQNPAERKEITRRIPAMREGTAEEIAAVVRFMVSGASYMTGSVLNVDGGRSIAW